MTNFSKATAGFLIAGTLAALTAYTVRRPAQHRTSRKALQRQIALLETLNAGAAELTEQNEELITLIARLKDEKDSISEMNEMEMLHLQQLTQASSQLEQMISNILKAMCQTESAIIGNLKD